MTSQYVQSMSSKSYTEGDLWKVVEIEGKGQGVIAKDCIEPGTLILEDSPLFIVPDKVHTKDPNTLDEYLADCVAKLSDEEKEIFFSLADSKNGGLKKARGIYFTNCYTLGSDNGSPTGMLPRLSRLTKHVCSCFLLTLSSTE